MGHLGPHDSRHVCLVLAVLLLATNAGLLRAQNPREFSIPTAASVPRGITAGPDGNLWFAELSGNKIGRITPAGVFTEYPIPHAAPETEPEGIVAGPDGNIWFAEIGVTNLGPPGFGSRIGRVDLAKLTGCTTTPANCITEFPNLTLHNRPSAITVGPDHNIWFVERGGVSKIGRIDMTKLAGCDTTPTLCVTEFTVPQPFGPERITAGPDNALWFTDDGAGGTTKIGRIDWTKADSSCVVDTTKCIVEYPISTPAGLPEGITSGPDGNIWFAELRGNKIGRILTDGSHTITEFSQAAGDITLGPDGALWFSNPAGNTVGRITTSGQVSNQVSLPTAMSSPDYIAKGPDGNIWFAESNANKIGRLTVGGGGPTTSPTPTLSVTPTRTPTGTSTGSPRGRVTPVFQPTPRSNIGGRQ